MAAEHDLELVERIRQGDKAALASYVEEHRASLTAYIGRRLSDMLRSKVEADDLVQETAAAALRSLPQADLSQREPFGWLCHLADERIVDAYRHHVRAQKRSAAREVRLPAPANDSTALDFHQILAASLTSPSQAFARNEREQALHRALAALPAEQREAIRLRFVEGLSSKEIARRIGKEDVAVRVMLSRAVGRLRALLKSVSTSLSHGSTPSGPDSPARGR